MTSLPTSNGKGLALAGTPFLSNSPPLGQQEKAAFQTTAKPTLAYHPILKLGIHEKSPLVKKLRGALGLSKQESFG